MGFFLDTIVDSATSMCVTALVTMAITLIFKTSYTTNFAQGVISAFGAYVVAVTLAERGVPIWVALLLGMFASMAFAMIVDVGIFRRGRYVNALSKQIISMGLISIIIGAMPLIFGTSTPGLPPFISGTLLIPVGDGEITITYNTFVVVGITVVVLAIIFLLLRFSKWGLSVRATASNEYVAGMMGINTHIVTAISWGLAGALGALAATLNATGGTTLGYYFMTEFQVSAFLAGILGGFSTFYGPVVTALIIPLANNLVTYFGNVMGMPEMGRWAKVIVYAIALIIIFFKPQGIFGKRIAKKV